jgi:GntR family transcriptional regulator of vanillate catabolism
MPISSQLTETVVRIREMILRGALAPGQRVAEAPLAEMLGMSRTPVRQALPLLAQEGLLMEHETRGYVVRAFTAADIIDAIEMRAALEGMAARRVAEKGASKAFIRELRSCLEDGDAILRKRHVVEADEALYADMNKRFHDVIMNEAGSDIFSDALDRNNRVPFAGAQALAFDRDNLDAMYDMLHYAHRQHHHIVDAIEQGEGARTESLMREHAIAVKSSINIAELRMAGPGGRLAMVR